MHEPVPFEERPRGSLNPSGGESLREVLGDGKFRLIERCSASEYEHVFRAEHLGIGREVELRRLPPGALADGPESVRLVHAARVAGLVAHRGIRSVVDTGRDESGRPFIVYEPVPGASLQEIVREAGGGVPLERAAELISQLLETLETAHSCGVAHRHIRPDCVFVSDGPDGRSLVKLGNFGWAGRLEGLEVQGAAAKLHTPELSRVYSPFLAPEVRRGASGASVAVDIFAVGVLFRFLLTGMTDHTGVIGGTARRVIEQAVADDPDERFTTAGSFLQGVSLLLPHAEASSPKGELSSEGLKADLSYLVERRVSLGSSAPRPGGTLELLPVLLTVEAMFARLGSDGWGQVVASVPDLQRVLPAAGHGGYFSSHGVPATWLARALAIVEAGALEGGGNLRPAAPPMVSELGISVAERGLRRICPSLPRGLTPAILVDCVPALWSSVVRDCQPRIVERGARGARVSAPGPRALPLELCGLLAGLFWGALTVSGVPRPHVRVSSAQACGDTSNIFTLTW